VETKDLVLKKLQEGKTTRYLLLDNGNRVYVINELLYDILALCQQTSNYESIIEAVNKKHSIDYVDTTFIKRSLETTMAKLTQKQGQKSLDFINLKLTVIKEGQFQSVYKLVSILFNPYIFALLCVFSIGYTCYFFIANKLLSLQFIYQHALPQLSLQNVAAVYLIMLPVIILHEIGHASASFRYGVKPKEIGFGFYFIFPVFFSNVTNIWQLDKLKRIVVNLGGIYLQLIVNVLLIFLYTRQGANPLIFMLIIINVGSIIGSLNPFFRYDGYWILSDSIGIPNLKAGAQKIAVKLFFDRPKNSMPFIKTQPKSLLIYVILNTAFWLYVYYAVMRYCTAAVSKISVLFSLSGWQQSQLALTESVVDAFSILLVFYLLILHLQQTLKVIRNETNGIFSGKK